MSFKTLLSRSNPFSRWPAIFTITLLTNISVVALLFLGGTPDTTVEEAQQIISGRQEATDEVKPVIYTVLYTEEGFEPDNLEIPLNAQVNFINETDIPLWVGSDPHPTHTDNVAFDAHKDYARGETYSFTFTTTGTFSYHNHEQWIDRGFIHVVDAQNPLPDIDKSKSGDTLIRDKFLAMFIPNDPNSIFTIIDALQADPFLSRNCHDIAHDLGHEAYSLYGFSEAMTFNNPNHVDHPLVQYICAGGYMHGILEQLSLHQPEFLTQPDLICAAVPEEDQASCYHGVGHVFMLAYERDTAESITGCRQIEYDSDMYRCFEGVRMEQFWGNTEHIGTDTLGWDLEDPLAPCIAAQTDEKPTCYLYSTFGYLRTHVKDYPGAVNLCTESDVSAEDSKFCLKGLGITMMSKFKGQNLEGSEVYVAELPYEQRYAFYQGVIGYALLSGVSSQELTNTCGLFLTDSLLCYEVLQESI